MHVAALKCGGLKHILGDVVSDTSWYSECMWARFGSVVQGHGRSEVLAPTGCIAKLEYSDFLHWLCSTWGTILGLALHKTSLLSRILF